MPTTTINAAETTGLLSYHPEMGETRPAAQIEASLGHYGKHYDVHSAMLLEGRGVEFIETIKPGSCINSRRDGWGYYKVTLKAFDAICAKHGVAHEMLLD